MIFFNNTKENGSQKSSELLKITALEDRLIELEEEKEKYIKTLTFYAKGCYDKGEKARRTLDE